MAFHLTVQGVVKKECHTTLKTKTTAVAVKEVFFQQVFVKKFPQRSAYEE
jgi:hypothetical protein